LLFSLCCLLFGAILNFFQLFVVLVFFVFINLHYTQTLRRSDAQTLRVAADVVTIDALAKKAAVIGYVTDLRHLSDERSRLDIKIIEVSDESQLYGLSQRLNLRLYLGHESYQFLPGDKIGFESSLCQPWLFQTPGEFKWPRYLVSQGTELTGWVKLDEIGRITGSVGISSQASYQLLGNQIAVSIKENLPQRRAQRVRTLMLGGGRALSDEIRQVLSQAGVSHLFVISGL